MLKALFTDTSRCIGCRGCQVACKQWNDLPAEPTRFSGSYENPRQLTARTWRTVRFAETQYAGMRWSFVSDACKHCHDASCLAVCPTGALTRASFGGVVLDQNRCNGCRYCVSACPFQVVAFDEEKGVAAKCSFCADRQAKGLAPACAATCPTGALAFGGRSELMVLAKTRLAEVRRLGYRDARLYGDVELSGFNNFYLLTEPPSAYGLPEKPRYSVASVFPGSMWSIGAAATVGLTALVAFRERRKEA